MNQYYQNRERDIRERWFPNHKATFEDQGKLKVLTWRNPENSNYWCRYVIDGSTLMVYGDIGEAIYRWSDKLTWEWLAKMDYDYFAGKCQASETGRLYKEWDAEKVKEWLEDHFSDSGSRREKFEDVSGWSSTGSKDEWQMFLSRHGYEIFEDCYYEMVEIGSVTNIRCQAHLIGIKRAIKNANRDV